jgi:Exopolysaccharide biosynthesis protein related to N-acetylglucosamine-1-phosphodiester alpha-N-acetylglucosaminidase
MQNDLIPEDPHILSIKDTNILRKSKRQSHRLLKLFSAITASLLSLVLIGYCLVVYSGIPALVYWRDIWIETAMTTMTHQWLATSFIPQDIIDGVMKNQNKNPDVIGGAETGQDSGETGTDTAADGETEVNDDILGQANIVVGEPDYAGYTVLVNDIEQGIVISEITGDGFKGRLMLIDDPSRVYMATTPYKDTEGLRILDMLDFYGAVAGINASGFPDPDGEGNGGKVMGLTYSADGYWGTYVSWWGSIILTNNNKLIVGNVSDWDKYNPRGGMQFGPVLIADGVIQVKGSAGWGIQPRTAIGQREDGVIAFLIIDGRDITYSIGCTVGDLAQILAKYNIVNAACCDGGASSVLAYNGELITRNSSANPLYGRRLPNAFLVAPK